MVAAIPQHGLFPPLPQELPPSLLNGRGSLVRFTVEDVLAMVQQGILPEDSTTELLNGWIVLKDRSDLGENPLMHGSKHRMCVRWLTAFAGRIETPNRHGQIQSSIICGGNGMPEPDFALIRGSDLDYEDQVPTESDVIMVAEVADSSLERDQTDKYKIYARAGIAHYLIFNLRNMTIEKFAEPDRLAETYFVKTTIRRDESFVFPGGPDGDVELRAPRICCLEGTRDDKTWPRLFLSRNVLNPEERYVCCRSSMAAFARADASSVRCGGRFPHREAPEPVFFPPWRRRPGHSRWRSRRPPRQDRPSTPSSRPATWQR